MTEITLLEAVTQALAHELRQDPNVVVFGQDVGVNGGVFRATDGLQKNSAPSGCWIRRWRKT